MNGRATNRGGIAPLFVVDAEYAEAVSQHSWFGHPAGYLWTTYGGKNVLLHRFVWRLAHGYDSPLIDHDNRCKWDCRISNLRKGSGTLNSLNAVKPKTKHHDLPRGVLLNKRSQLNPYQARIQIGGVRKNLGAFPTPDLASAAYEQAWSQAIREEAEKSKRL